MSDLIATKQSLKKGSVDSENTSTKMLDVLFGGFSDKGVKVENQDAFAAQQAKGSARELKGSVVCIADGASCSDNAQQASQTSVTTFIRDYFSTPESWSTKDSVARVLSSLNSWLFHHGQQASCRQNQLVTTFSAVIFKSNTAYLCHAGDSRVYLYRQGKVEQLTKDHSYFQNEHSSVLTRALGMDSHLEVDFIQRDLQLNDRFVLTTDGVHDCLTNKQLEAHLSNKELSLEKIATEICLTAEQAGSKDNLSCIIAEVVNLPNKDIDEVHQQLTALKIPPVMKPGVTIDNYLIEKVIHSGARSHVYVAKDKNTEQKVVLKAPSDNFAEDLNYLEGFVREQWVGSRINHKSIMKIYPRVKENGQATSPFLYHVCEYVEGITLRQWMYDNPNPSLSLVRDVTAKIIAGLRVFQRQSMVHRDLKPENIMIENDGNIKLIDFGTVQVSGLAEISSPLIEDTLAGAVGYIAPEYLLGQQGVHRSDIFSLGVIVYEMLTGELPFKTPLVQHQQVTNFDQWQYRFAKQIRKDIPVWLDLALQKATQPNISSRYLALSEFLKDLTTPNRMMVNKIESAPLLERNPVGFWKMLSTLLAFLLIIQTYLFYR
ncbi:bifunctional protein-serine/threonine kinase/phosphatase [uncultured Psychrosphaera sp.]|uniref:bifunctional protein-serine/threonine kinase/phosphatase n=1 Tax=uncultured Psychrosphaera sp. TaxID=1403522 RepID=UPI00261986DB|nr:bifunctional protein-serine/threonine kinase/phosphatase [uncultured Psychrosphaera sp.]